MTYSSNDMQITNLNLALRSALTVVLLELREEFLGI